ncbi:MAG: TMEM165/GDT1 family protein [Elusimicrobiota bacterium]
MDIKIFFTTFAAILVAELADKTQLIGISMSAKSESPFVVWLGSVSAYMIITGISVLAGSYLAGYLSPTVIRYGAGFVFIAIGVLLLAGKMA